MMRRETNWIRWLSGLVVLLPMIFAGSPLRADIYMYVDPDGVVHFTNAPTASDTEDYQVYVRDRRAALFAAFSTDRYDDYIKEAARLNGVSFPLLKAVIKAESDFDPHAISKKGALGLMQIMPQNLDSLDVNDPFDPWENIMGGARYLRQMLDRFEGKLTLSLAAYNAGPTAVERFNYQIPPFKETQSYVEKVLTFYYSFKY